MATIVGVAAGRDTSVGDVALAGGRGVAVETRGGVGAWGEQAMTRITQKAESRMRIVMGGSMKGSLTELSTNNVSPINEKNFRLVPETNPSFFVSMAELKNVNFCLGLSRYVIQI